MKLYKLSILFILAFIIQPFVSQSQSTPVLIRMGEGSPLVMDSTHNQYINLHLVLHINDISLVSKIIIVEGSQRDSSNIKTNDIKIIRREDKYYVNNSYLIENNVLHYFFSASKRTQYPSNVLTIYALNKEGQISNKLYYQVK